MEYKSSAELINSDSSNDSQVVDNVQIANNTQVNDKVQINDNKQVNNAQTGTNEGAHTAFSAYESVDVAARGGLSGSFFKKRFVRSGILLIIGFAVILACNLLVHSKVDFIDTNFIVNNFVWIFIIIIFAPTFIIWLIRRRASGAVGKAFSDFPNYTYYNYFKDKALDSREYIKNLPIIGKLEVNLNGSVLDFVKHNDGAWDYVELIINVLFSRGGNEKLFKGGILSVYKDLSFLPETFIFYDSKCGPVMKRNDLQNLNGYPINIAHVPHNVEKTQALQDYLTMDRVNAIQQFMSNYKVDIIILSASKIQLYFEDQNLFKGSRSNLKQVIMNDLNKLSDIVRAVQQIF